MDNNINEHQNFSERDTGDSGSRNIIYNEAREIQIYKQSLKDGSHPVYKFFQSGCFQFDHTELGNNPRSSFCTCPDDEFAVCFVFYLGCVLRINLLTQQILRFTKWWSTGLLHEAIPVLEQRYGIKVDIKTLSMSGGKRVCLVGAKIDYIRLIELIGENKDMKEYDLGDENEILTGKKDLSQSDAATIISERANQCMQSFRETFLSTFFSGGINDSSIKISASKTSDTYEMNNPWPKSGSISGVSGLHEQHEAS